MCKNEQKPELEPEPCYKKRDLRSRSYTPYHQEIRSWSRSHVHEKSSRAGIFTTALQPCINSPPMVSVVFLICDTVHRERSVVSNQHPPSVVLPSTSKFCLISLDGVICCSNHPSSLLVRNYGCTHLSAYFDPVSSVLLILQYFFTILQ